MNAMKYPMNTRITRSMLSVCLIGAGLTLSACSSSSPKRDRSSNLEEIDPSMQVLRQNRAKAREHYATATKLYKEGKHDEALEEYRNALELDDQLYAAWNNMGQLLMEQNNYADAVSAFQIAARIEPTDPRPLYNTGLAYQRGLGRRCVRELPESAPARSVLPPRDARARTQRRDARQRRSGTARNHQAGAASRDKRTVARLFPGAVQPHRNAG